MNDDDVTDASGEELAQLLAKRSKPQRARSTTALIAALLILFGVLIGIPLGRATAPQSPQVTPVVSEQGQ